MQTILCLAISLVSAAPTAELVAAIGSDKLAGPDRERLEAAVGQALSERGIRTETPVSFGKSLPKGTVEGLRACKDAPCVLEFALNTGLAGAWVVEVKGAGSATTLALTHLLPTKTGGAIDQGSTPWNAGPDTLTQAAKTLLSAALPAPKPAAPTVVAASPAAASVEPTVLEPPATDLRGRVRFLAQRLHAGYRSQAGDALIHRVAIMDFDNIGVEATTQRLGAVVAEIMITELSAQPGVIIVERARLKELVAELKLQKTADLDPRTATEIGKFLGAASMIVGSVAEAGAQYVISARQVSVETAAVTQAESVSVDRGELVALSKDLVELKTPAGAALRSAVVPGWGQIYSGNTTVGAAFMGAGVLSAVAAGTFATLYKVHGDRYQKNTADTVGERDTGNRYGTLTNTALGVYAGVWVLNIVHAYLTGRDSTEVRAPESSVTAVVGY